MELIDVLLKQLFGNEQAGGQTVSVEISMNSPSHCTAIRRYSTCGGNKTEIKFAPPLPLEEALLQARKYNERGTFNHP
jgi:hypothetical protein